MKDTVKEKLLKTIKNPNVSKSKKVITRDKMISLEIWKNEYDKYLLMKPEELYELLDDNQKKHSLSKKYRK